MHQHNSSRFSWDQHGHKNAIRYHWFIGKPGHGQNPRKYVLTKITTTIKHLPETNKILTEKIRTLTGTNARLTSNGGHQEKQGGQANMGNEYEFRLDPTEYWWTHGYNLVKRHTRATWCNRNNGHMKKKQIWHHGRNHQEHWMGIRSIWIRVSQQDQSYIDVP